MMYILYRIASVVFLILAVIAQTPYNAGFLIVISLLLSVLATLELILKEVRNK